MTVSRCIGLLAVFCLVLLPVGGALAQEAGDQPVKLAVSDTDRSAATGASGSFKHILPPRSASGAAHKIVGKQLVPRTKSIAAASARASSDFDDFSLALPKPGFYPADVVNTSGGPVVVEAVSHPIYVNTTRAAVGAPSTLLQDLGKSELIHVLDQYIGRTGNNRYKAGAEAVMSYKVSGALQDSDIAAILHAAASQFKQTGYTVIYHLFFAPGQDVCSLNEAAGGPITCYSPDNADLFTFCAYHDALDFPDIGHVLYTVMPFQAVDGCQTGPPSPNGLVVDSTMNSLSHELFETITDPDGTAWWNTNSADLYGDEIEDECDLSSTAYPVAKLNGKWYEVEGAYSNKYHGCAFQP